MCTATRHCDRDVALKNVFLAGDGTVKLGDFGVARVLESTQELAVTKVGTPCYIAPERGARPAYSYEADVWAMGCLLYELVTTRPAFSAETMPSVVSAKILKGELSPFDETDSSIPQGVRSLITTILSVAPSRGRRLRASWRTTPSSSRTSQYERVRIRLAAQTARRRIVGRHPAHRVRGPVVKDRSSPSGPCLSMAAGALSTRKPCRRTTRVLARGRGGRGSSRRNAGASGGSGGSSIGLGSASSASAAGRRSGPDFSKPMNFGAGGVVGFIVQQSSSAAPAAAAGKDQQAGGGGGGAAPQEISASWLHKM